MEFRKLKHWITTTPNKAYYFVETIGNNGDIILFGGGYASYWYIKFLNKFNIFPKFIVDNDKEKQGKKFHGIPVVSLEEALDNTLNYCIVVTAPRFLDEIKDIAMERCDKNRIFSFEAEIYYTFIQDINEYKSYLLNNWERFVALFEMLEDELSQRTLIAFIKGRVSGEQHYFIDVMVPDQYYPSDIITFKQNETMVELGSNDGKTLLEFLEKINRKYNKIYCFEPDKFCIEKLKTLVANEKGNIKIVEAGGWDKPGRLSFCNDAEFGASHIKTQYDEIADDSILVDTVDNCVSVPVTYMKMDIEGAELKALYGSKNTIIKNKPQLAICIYHNQDDLLNIVDYLKTIVPEYKLYLRHHNWGAAETVLYAVVK